MNMVKKWIAALLCVGVCMSLSACAEETETPGETPAVIALDEAEIAFDEHSALSGDARRQVAEQLAAEIDATETRTWPCRLFGHTMLEEVVTLTRHRAAEAAPRCLVETWDIRLCTRCGHLEKTSADQYYADCCPTEATWEDYEQDLYGEQITTAHEAALFLTVRANGWMQRPDTRPRPVQDGHIIDTWTVQDETTHVGICTGDCCRGGEDAHVAVHRYRYAYTVEEKDGAWWITEKGSCVDCGYQMERAPYTEQTHEHKMSCRHRALRDEDGKPYHVLEEWCSGCLYLVRTPFPCLSPEGKHCASYGCLDQIEFPNYPPVNDW